MTIDHRLRSLEIARRRALWALANLQPGDARAEKVLAELDEVDQGLPDIESGDQLSAQKLVDLITTKLHNGVQLVVEESIPEPWLQRFQAASVGSTRLAEGPYLRDFEKFVAVWHQELEHLKAHRAHRSSTRSQ
ncbi:hypothetical protein CMV24_06355 [Pseudomonas plecoglossicida]|uniref:Uncharacterized protein n=1 Tax=Pseudomonas plecoglossicida TaxID=70775 RepID=A0A2A3M8F0_PSEDL|nr:MULTISPECIES: hypothetical protein [Pseudomonas]MBN4165657.1 hypothetical protein [Pseudomonas fulva]KLJ14400.1 hypothetical protein G1E_33275 [Pseudomonas sp. TJI-51]MBF8766102.1 hypothetical protein [Pseudomonas putida]MDH1927888.1 hypothetical protein [Pseudomonas sp. GD03696]PBJ96343.1 hypothetical protein CMV24_06355 [Pseudomonas plecoglossicida]